MNSINWNNINLNSAYELSQPILDPYTFDTLLLEISCNLKVITKETVKAQAMESIKAKYQTAIDILESNLNNLTNEALKYRAIK